MAITVYPFKKSNVGMRATLLNDLEATADGEWVRVEGLEKMSVHVRIATTATAQVRVSNEDAPANNTDGAKVGDDLTASGLVQVPVPVRWVKVKISAHTTGKVSAFLEAIP